MTDPPRTPAECLSGILNWLMRTVDAPLVGRKLVAPLFAQFMNRICSIHQRFASLAARVAAGTYVPRRPPASPRRHLGPRVRQPNLLPKTFGWLPNLVPETRVYGSQLEYLFRDPAMAALMATAPAPLSRPLRSLCRMLGVTPPPILALPAKTKPPPPAKTTLSTRPCDEGEGGGAAPAVVVSDAAADNPVAAPKPSHPHPGPPTPPAWMTMGRRQRQRSSSPPVRGPPFPRPA